MIDHDTHPVTSDPTAYRAPQAKGAHDHFLWVELIDFSGFWQVFMYPATATLAMFRLNATSYRLTQDHPKIYASHSALSVA